MVAIGLSANAVARIRFAVSCLWEVVASLRVLRHPSAHSVHLPWVAKVRPHLMRRLAEEITEYWTVALAADWPRIRTLLNAEVLTRARLLAENGAAALLNNLHERVQWQGDGGLRINQRYCSAPDVPQGGGIVLVPSVFVWPSILSVATGESPQLAFPAGGAATLWEEPPQTPDALSAVIGRGRAQLLLEMRTPVSTTELARRTGMSPSGVSQHLTALRAAGLVTAHRAGRTILNTRTTVADALLAASP